MSRPPILEVIDWSKIFDMGKDYDAWLNNCEFPEHRDRMEEQRKNLFIEPQARGFLSALPRIVYVIAFAEDWCGDVMRHVPVLAHMAELAPNLKVRYLKREESTQTFVRFLTNGGEAIPKFIFLNNHFVECGNWGPMSEACREIIARGKACGDLTAARKKVSAFYAAEPAFRIEIKELINLIDIASTIAP